MTTQVRITPRCADQVKSYSRQYADFKGTFDALCASLEKTPSAGIPLGKKLFKLRLPMSGQGKSGGFRVIYHYDPKNHEAKGDGGTLTLLFFYRKSERGTIEPKEIARLLKQAGLG